MATTTRTTAAASASSTATQISTASGYFVAGNTITSANITYLSQLIRNISNHTHTLTEYTTVATYGDTGTTTPVNRTTTANTLTSLVADAAGSLIQAADFNKMRTDISTMRSHNHGFSDSY